MGYSEFYCQFCGVSFNIVFRLESGELDLPYDKQDEAALEQTDSVIFLDEDDMAYDPDYLPEEVKDSEPYEYDSDHESVNAMSDDSETVHGDQEICTDTDLDIESEWYRDWVLNTFDCKGLEREEPVGYYDSPMSGYRVDAISPEETKDCRTAQFLIHKIASESHWEPDVLHEPWENTESWFLSGICDGTPSRDTDNPTVWPARGGIENLRADNVIFNPQNEDPDSIAMPFHPWCFDIFCRQSKLHFKRVNLSGLMTWRNAEFDWHGFRSFPRAKDVKKAREQWWFHEPGSEYLVANPLYVPGLPALLLDAVRDQVNSRLSPSDSPPTCRADCFSSLPSEIRLSILDLLGSEDITSLRAASRTFTTLPNNVWYRLVREEMPWLWEAWDETECVHDPLPWTVLTTAEVKRTIKARSRYSKVLTEDSYMSRTDAEKAAEKRIPLLYSIPDQIKLPRGDTDWHHVFTQVKRNWNKLKGLRNRQRIWEDVDEIVRRIRKFDT